MKNKQQYVVWGLGRFGKSVALTLAQLGHEVLGIDSDEDVVQRLSSELTHVVALESIDEKTIKALDIEHFDVAIVSIGNMEANMLCVMLLKEAGVPKIVAKAANQVHGRMLEKIGADMVIYPERDMGRRVAHNLSSSNIMDYIELSDDASIMEIGLMPKLEGKNLIEANLRQRLGVNVVAVKRGGQTLINLNPQEPFQQGDVLIVIGTKNAVNHLESRM